MSKCQTDMMKKLIEEMGGKVIVLDPKSKGYFNPLDIEVTEKNDSDIEIFKGSLIERLKTGGFGSLREVSEIAEKFDKTNDPIAKEVFNEWWEKDGSKESILKLIEKLKL